ncbi:MAG: 30S ribosomal protein S1 [Crocinitomicaceae bacterium]|nr:30S ribosomal protein S1 [Crocinitomicaceae bacterium]
MAESKRVKAEEAEDQEPIIDVNEGAENPSVDTSIEADEVKVKIADEPVEAEESVELFSTADEEAFLLPGGEFNWDAFESAGGYTKEDRARYDAVYENTLSTIAEKEVVDGTVVSVNKKEVVVNIGYKSEGVIPVTEFRYNPDLKAGDVVPVYVEQQEDKNGQLSVSHKTARVFSAWGNVNRALESGEIIKGDVKCRTKGGLIVDVFGIEAFLPGSQIDVKPIRDYDVYVGKVMELKVVKINNEFKNVVVSHKALIEAELEEQKKQIMSGLEKGQVLEGVVKNITSYGVFVDLGGVDGLIHITDLSWGRINHPEEVVQLDQKINVVILDFDDEKKRIALGLKQLSAHPWDALQDQLQAGQKVKGKVVVLADYGAFVEVAPGVEGLIHVSEMSWSSHLRSAQDFLKVGEEVECLILNVDKDERKLSLGMKQLTPDPWENIEARFPVESKHKAKVRAFTNFGVFCELTDGIDGLIHISDLSWSKKIKHPGEFCAVGDEIDVVVLELDKENRRISLGHKQIEENPWDVFETVFTDGSRHQGTVTKKEGSHAIVTLPYGLEGFCMNKNLKKADGSTAKPDEALEFVVLEFNKNQRKINVSHTHTWKEEEPSSDASSKPASKSRGAAKKSDVDSSAVKAVNAQVEKSTLGDLDALMSLKEKMEGKTPENENPAE